MRDGEEPSAFVVGEETGAGELEIIRARQRLALTVGGLCLVALLVAGLLIWLLMERWSQIASLTSPTISPNNPFSAIGTASQPGTGLAQVPVAPGRAPGGILQTPIGPEPSLSPLQTPVRPIPGAEMGRVPGLPSYPYGAASPTPPGQIPDYLEQLRRIEQERKRQSNNLWIALGALRDLLGAFRPGSVGDDVSAVPEGNPEEKALPAYDAYRASFEGLRQQLHQLQPPPECQRLHQAYDAALQQHIETIESLKRRILANDLGGVVFYGLGAQGRIDSALAVADSELENVCAQLRIPKFFSIGSR